MGETRSFALTGAVSTKKRDTNRRSNGLCGAPSGTLNYHKGADVGSAFTNRIRVLMGVCRCDYWHPPYLTLLFFCPRISLT